jgi:hypothetical protein
MQVAFRDLDDGSGRMEVTWPEGRKAPCEFVPLIPAFLLSAALLSLYHDTDEVVAQNLSPFSMAQVSPRTFWALVRHGGAGSEVDFGDALKKLAPNVDWGKLRVGTRQRRKPAKLLDAADE